jgi:hypothetical protein
VQRWPECAVAAHLPHGDQTHPRPLAHHLYEAFESSRDEFSVRVEKQQDVRGRVPGTGVIGCAKALVRDVQHAKLGALGERDRHTAVFDDRRPVRARASSALKGGKARLEPAPVAMRDYDDLEIHGPRINGQQRLGFTHLKLDEADLTGLASPPDARARDPRAAGRFAVGDPDRPAALPTRDRQSRMIGATVRPYQARW